MKHTVIIDKPSEKLIIARELGKFYSDGAICGNGDVQIVLGGTAEKLSLFFNKADFWKTREGRDTGVGEIGGPRSIARLEIKLAQDEAYSYYVEERLDDGELYAKMGDYKFNVVPCATENIVLLKVSYPKHIKAPELKLCVCEGNESRFSSGVENGICYVERSFESDEFYFKSFGIVTYKKIEEVESNDLVEQLYAFCLVTNHDMAPYKIFAVRTMRELTKENCEVLYQAHHEWWNNFWSKSKVKMDDAELELNWYFGLYVMACCARNVKFPPGIIGSFVTSDDVPWNGDYHGNYNFQAPFYPLASSNHIELLECYDAGYQYFVPRGKRYAKEFLGCRGVYYPVGIGPLGYHASVADYSVEHGMLFLGQKSNAIHFTSVVVMRWYSTLDIEYAKKVYPYMLEVAHFWEDYLTYENGRYIVKDDAIHEVDTWRRDFDPEKHGDHRTDMNSLLTLGLLRMFFTCLLNMCEHIDNDNKNNAKWKEILEKLSPYATFVKDGKEVFRYTEKGMEWYHNNGLCIQHIYPCNGVDLSDEKMRQICLNTFRVANRWVDNNCYSSYYPCAARLGISPEEIIEHMKVQFRDFQFPSKMYFIFGGWLENSSAATNTLNEMMLQSFDGTVKVFPCFPKAMDCSFENLRAYGAFLVSSEQKDGKVLGVTIFSEKGEELKLKNPYAEAKVCANGKEFVSSDEYITLKTTVGETITVSPNKN